MYPNLEAELKRRNIKRIDLAKHLGMGISAISDKMQHKSDFSLGAAIAIKKFLGVNFSLEYLFARNDEQRLEGDSNEF